MAGQHIMHVNTTIKVDITGVLTPYKIAHL